MTIYLLNYVDTWIAKKKTVVVAQLIVGSKYTFTLSRSQ